MNAKPKTRIKAEAAVFVPQSLEEVNGAIAEIGVHQRDRKRIETEMQADLAAARARYEADAAPHADKIKELSQGVQVFCEAHRGELTKDGKTKTIKFAAGEVSWRMRPPSIVVRGTDAVISALRRLKLDRFLRTKVELDKSAMLNEPQALDGIRGIVVSQREDFVLRPFSTQLEEIR